MSDALASDQPHSAEKIYNGLQRAMDAYAAQYDHKKSLMRRLRDKAHFLILGMLPGKLKNSLKALLALNGPEIKEEDHLSLVEVAENFESAGVYVNFEELAQIVNIVKNFHNENKFDGIC